MFFCSTVSWTETEIDMSFWNYFTVLCILSEVLTVGSDLIGRVYQKMNTVSEWASGWVGGCEWASEWVGGWVWANEGGWVSVRENVWASDCVSVSERVHACTHKQRKWIVTLKRIYVFLQLDPSSYESSHIALLDDPVKYKNK